jgi:hypothetical protein
MGARGPIPKRDEQRRLRNKADTATTRIVPKSGPAEQPPPDFPAHPIAADWYRSLAVSGQANFTSPRPGRRVSSRST